MSKINKQQSYFPPKTKQPTDIRYVYLLRDPRDNTPKYVGQAECVISRLGAHLAVRQYRIGSCSQRMCTWLEGLKNLLLIPKIEILETTTLERVSERESYWIHYWLKQYPILNIASVKTDKSSKRYQYYKTRRNRIRAVDYQNETSFSETLKF